MSDADPVFADWMIHMIPFLFISALFITGFVASIYWISSAAYKMPTGLKDEIGYYYIVGCFEATDSLTSRQISAVDGARFTSIETQRCLPSGAYRLKINDKVTEKVIATTSWDNQKTATKIVPVAVQVFDNGKISDATLTIEVQT